MLDLEAEGLHPDIIKKRKEATNRFWTNLRIKENMLVQKSRLKWLNEGDFNSGFFQKVMKDKRRLNHIGPINSPGGPLASVNDIKNELVRHFSNKFGGEVQVNPLLDGILFSSIGVEEMERLERSFQEDEIKEEI